MSLAGRQDARPHSSCQAPWCCYGHSLHPPQKDISKYKSTGCIQEPTESVVLSLRGNFFACFGLHMQEEVFFGGPAKVLHVGNATEILGLFRLEKTERGSYQCLKICKGWVSSGWGPATGQGATGTAGKHVLHTNMGKYFFAVRVTTALQQAVEHPSLEIFKTHLDTF